MSHFSEMSNSALVFCQNFLPLQANHALLNQNILTANILHLHLGLSLILHTQFPPALPVFLPLFSGSKV